MFRILRSIGIIRTPFKTRNGIPIQPAASNGTKGSIIMKNKYIPALKDLDGFSHIILIYLFHKSRGYEMQVIPFLDRVKRGLFATRAPRRPNQIGLSVVKLIRMKDNILEIENVDMLDGTPLLDIKPYVPKFNAAYNIKTGWLDEEGNEVDQTVSDKRFVRFHSGKKFPNSGICNFASIFKVLYVSVLFLILTWNVL